MSFDRGGVYFLRCFILVALFFLGFGESWRV